MILPLFELYHPRSKQELTALCKKLNASGQDFDFIAGGTDVLPNYKNRLNAKEHLISLSAMEGMDEIELHRIGALASIAELAKNSLISEHFPGLTEAARQISSPPLRNLASVGGNLLLDTRCFYFNQSEFWRASKNYCLKADGDVCLVVPQKEICYATYSGDLAPVFLVLNASVLLCSPRGERSVALREFYEMDGIKRFVKEPDELLCSVQIPKDAQALRTGYKKLRVRDTIEYPVMGVALGLACERGHVARLEVAVTGSEAIPRYYGDLGMKGKPANMETAVELQHALLARVKAYRTVPFPPGYRKAMAGEFVRELFLALV